jgi:Na+/melibiose symporter-like transporter
VLPDGRRVDEARDGTAPTAIAIKAPTVSLAPLVVGTDWISIARWITMAYGALQVLGIFALALLIPSITVPVQDPSTGLIVDQTLNIRPFLALVAFVAIVFFALIVWLTKYGLARAIVLLVVILEALGAISRMSGQTSTVVAASIGSLLCDAGYAFVLVMTFIALRRHRRHRHHHHHPNKGSKGMSEPAPCS